MTLAVNSAASVPTIITIAGNGTKGYSGDGGSATSAAFNQPTRVVADATGNYFVVDNDNNRIRKVDVNGTVTTVAGDGQSGFGGDGGPATAASLSFGSNPQLFPYFPMGRPLRCQRTLFRAFPSRPAQPGDVLTIYGVGFGPVTGGFTAGLLLQPPIH